MLIFGTFKMRRMCSKLCPSIECLSIRNKAHLLLFHLIATFFLVIVFHRGKNRFLISFYVSWHLNFSRVDDTFSEIIIYLRDFFFICSNSFSTRLFNILSRLEYFSYPNYCLVQCNVFPDVPRSKKILPILIFFLIISLKNTSFFAYNSVSRSASIFFFFYAILFLFFFPLFYTLSVLSHI